MVVTLASTNRIPGPSVCNVSDGWLESADAKGFETETCFEGKATQEPIEFESNKNFMQRSIPSQAHANGFTKNENYD